MTSFDTIYDRAHSAISQIESGMIDWKPNKMVSKKEVFELIPHLIQGVADSNFILKLDLIKSVILDLNQNLNLPN